MFRCRLKHNQNFWSICLPTIYAVLALSELILAWISPWAIMTQRNRGICKYDVTVSIKLDTGKYYTGIFKQKKIVSPSLSARLLRSCALLHCVRASPLLQWHSTRYFLSYLIVTFRAFSTQWAAVTTQLESTKVPPHWNITCGGVVIRSSACHGQAPKGASVPPTILLLVLYPNWRNPSLTPFPWPPQLPNDNRK